MEIKELCLTYMQRYFCSLKFLAFYTHTHTRTCTQACTNTEGVRMSSLSSEHNSIGSITDSEYFKHNKLEIIQKVFTNLNVVLNGCALGFY